jgi:hypothetical protein
MLLACFQVEAHEMRVKGVYAIRLIEECVWDNINDIVGNQRRLETDIQYEKNFGGDGVHGTRTGSQLTWLHF